MFWENIAHLHLTKCDFQKSTCTLHVFFMSWSSEFVCHFLVMYPFRRCSIYNIFSFLSENLIGVGESFLTILQPDINVHKIILRSCETKTIFPVYLKVATYMNWINVSAWGQNEPFLDMHIVKQVANTIKRLLFVR